MSSNAQFNSEAVFPRFMALQYIAENSSKYLAYHLNTDATSHGYLGFTANQVLDFSAKFETVPVTIGGQELYHIRCCSKNKYWSASQGGDWIVAAAEKPVSDKNAWNCTLFKLTVALVNGDMVTFTHVGQGRAVGLATGSTGEVKFLSMGDPKGAIVAKMVDVGSIMILPRYVCFKGKNNKYLQLSQKNISVPGGPPVWYDFEFRPTNQLEKHTNLQFAAKEMSNKAAIFEVTNTDDGFIRIMSIFTGKYLRVEEVTKWVEADIVDGEDGYKPDPLRYMYEAILVNREKNLVALKSKVIGMYCMSKDGDFQRSHCLWAGASTPEENAQFELVEPIIDRRIDFVEFRLNEARIISETLIQAATDSYSNASNVEISGSPLELSFEETKTNTWNNSISTKTTNSFGFKSGIPDVLDAEFVVGGEYSKDYQWGNTVETKIAVKKTLNSTVAPWTRSVGKLFATKGTIEVPFTYTQTDRLTTGELKTYKLQDGVFTAVSTYNFYTTVHTEPIPRK